MKALEKLKSHLTLGQVYRRTDLKQWTTAVDRHLKALQKDGTLQKLSGGLYAYPKQTVFGKAPPSDKKLVQAFLKDSRFLMFSPGVYNDLNLGTTQLYNETLVYNYKRSGMFQLGNRVFHFVKKAPLPKKLTQEYLLVDLVGRRKNLQKIKQPFDKISLKK
tara:strand:- start:4072 stop:4554 length:483 start_codon:yes stop_codon:yes gene_type:complete